MKLLVTGGLGFMGSNFIRYMLATYPDVEILNLDKMTYAGNPENLRDLQGEQRYHFHKGDIADAATVQTLVRSFQPAVIVNYAAETHVDRSILEPDAFIRTDILGTYNLLEAVRHLHVPRFVQISTDEVYGSVVEGESREESPFDPSSPYSASKAGADHLVHAYYRTFATPTIITHACNNYGPFQYPEKLVPLFITNLLEGKKVPMYGAGMNIREWIYVLDHAKAIDCVIRQAEEGGVYNIGSGVRVTNMEMTMRLLALLGKDDGSIEYVADRPGHDQRYALQAERIHKLGWQAEYSLDQGLASTVAWYQANTAWWQKLKSGAYLDYYRRQYEERQSATHAAS